MSIKKTLYVWNIAIVISLCNLSMVAMDTEKNGIKSAYGIRRPHAHNQHNRDVDVTVATLKTDKLVIRKYVIDRVGNDIKKAKRWGKGMAKAFGGISGYVFDAIPFEFFADSVSIDEAFNRLEEGAKYIKDLKDSFKKNAMGGKKKINQSQLAEFIYGHLVDKLTVTDAQRALLKKEPIKMDEFVRKGIVKRSEYMYYTLLNFVVRYYLEQEVKNR